MNLLIIHTDQLSTKFLGCYGSNVLETPNIDSLADEGAIFNNFYTNSAICTPSRGCLLTGRYPNQHGAYKNNINLNSDEVKFYMQLEKNRYKTRY
jgi:arylsulfatase A-like enzyme